MPYYCRRTPPDHFFPTAKKRSYLGEVGKGWLITYSNFYLKIYPSQEQKGMMEIYQYYFGEESPYRVDVIPQDSLAEWSKQFDHCE